LAALGGCGGAAANGEWIREAEGGNLGSAPLAYEQDATVSTPSDSAPKGGPQRLDHTVTLGSIYEAPPDPAAPAAQAPTSITINVNNYGGGYGPTPYYGYGYAPIVGGGFRPGGGGGFPPSGGSPSHGGGSSTITPGQSWPAAPSYGPAFPYHLSPASPWETKR
jgi:hypothetical protein